MIEAALWVGILIVAFGLSCFALLFGLLALPRRRPQPLPGPRLPLSVLICAHNEADKLRRYLPEVLAQDYPDEAGHPFFEVVVVNDASGDASAALLEALARQHPHLRVLTIGPEEPRLFPGKKFALSRALEAAQYAHVVCTDADCKPAGKYWLRELAGPLAAGKEIVAGYGGYFQEKGLLNAFIRYETVHTFMQYSAFCRAGFPYMAVGRNLAATRAAYLQAQQSAAWAALPSGDDDLLVQAVATARNMALADRPEAFSYSEPKRRLGEYLAQKRRHVSTAKFYSLRSRMLPGLYALMLAAWWLLLASALCFQMPGLSFLVLLLPMLALLLVQQALGRRMQEPSALWGWLLFLLGWMLYNAVLAPYTLWKTRQRWT